MCLEVATFSDIFMAGLQLGALHSDIQTLINLTFLKKNISFSLTLSTHIYYIYHNWCDSHI